MGLGAGRTGSFEPVAISEACDMIRLERVCNAGAGSPILIQHCQNRESDSLMMRR